MTKIPTSTLRHLHYIYQSILLTIQLPFQSPLNYLFKQKGIERIFIIRSEKGDYKANLANEMLFKMVSQAVRDGVEIQLALGEMGHRFIDHPLILDSFQYAFTYNCAQIEILHGPRIDPDTEKIFELARQGIVKLFMASHYNRHHFIIIKRKNGITSILDENVHNEALWRQDSKGSPEQLYTSRYRVYFFHSQSRGLAKTLKVIFENRKQGSRSTPIEPDTRPSFAHPYQFPILRTVVLGFLYFPLRWLVQPIQNYFDRPLFYKKNSLQGKPKQALGINPMTKSPAKHTFKSQHYNFDEVEPGVYYIRQKAKSSQTLATEAEFAKQILNSAATPEARDILKDAIDKVERTKK